MELGWELMLHPPYSPDIAPSDYYLFRSLQNYLDDVYCQQLDKLNAAIKEKRPELVNRKGVIFHHNNVRPHTSLVTRQKLMELGWELMLHPPYSPDIAPSDYYLFRSLQNYLDGKTFKDDEAVKSHLDQFLPIKTRSSTSVEL
ncbi:PREDICTED: histone-lysine N-methyltransferase SETMAR-like [Dinoponera quadriceps]|uniref:Histone-lysine N-methyltransferase SETMAR-like n=1 Tax=Dinoponera quadriceps TaxID=609295 RepID=A0A6P3XW39_DINQU|nr:PREDICTED: histone-lysine N-methyltransferase SETMAR-like [Dinoponera quadriceps]